MASFSRDDRPTPNGGDYSIIYYYDDSWNPCDESVAAWCSINELKSDGTLVGELVGRCTHDY